METFTDDTVVALASFLSPHDMLSLALSCKRFGNKYGNTTSRSRRMAARESNKSRGSDREVRQRTESISLMEGAARTILHTKWTDDEKNALPRRGNESWIGLYQEFLLVFRLPLQFDKFAGQCMKYVERGNKTTVCSFGLTISSAICSNVMRAGKHCVSFQVNDDNPTKYGILCGIMRPTREDITSLAQCHPADDDLFSFSLKDYEVLHQNNVDCCLFNTCTGNGLLRRWKTGEWRNVGMMGFIHWEGMEETREASFKIGFVLDLDEGTLDVYKNDRRLGTMKSGLVGEYCWVVSREGSVSVAISRQLRVLGG